MVPFIYDNFAETSFTKECIPVQLNGRKFEIDPEGKEIQSAPIALTNAYDNALKQAKESRARGAQASYPKHLPQPGFGWGKTVSSDPGASALADDRMMMKPKVVEQGTTHSAKPQGDPKYPASAYSALKGRYYYVREGNRLYLASVKRTDWQNGLIYIRARELSPATGSSFFDLKPSLRLTGEWFQATVTGDYLLDPQKASWAGSVKTCQWCEGTGVITSSHSHVNDYTHTLGKKTTYTWSVTGPCSPCSGRGSWVEK